MTSTAIMSLNPVTSYLMMVCTMLGLKWLLLRSITSFKSLPLHNSMKI